MSPASATPSPAPRPTVHWEQLIEEALLHPSGEQPSLARALTRLQHLRQAHLPASDWDELTWLGNEMEAHDRRRTAKHPLWKWNPRIQLQAATVSYQLRGALKLAALLRLLDQWSRRQSGRPGCVATSSGPRPPWTPVERAAQALESDPKPTTEAVATFLTALTPALNALLRNGPRDLTTDPLIEASLAHFSWHAREASLPPTQPLWLCRLRRADPRNTLFTIAIREGHILLQAVHRELLQAELGPCELPFIV